MKKILILFLFIVLFSCCKKIPSKNKSNRIKFIETTLIKDRRYDIIKVDDKEYFVSTKGSIVELKSKY